MLCLDASTCFALALADGHFAFASVSACARCVRLGSYRNHGEELRRPRRLDTAALGWWRSAATPICVWRQCWVEMHGLLSILLKTLEALAAHVVLSLILQWLQHAAWDLRRCMVKFPTASKNGDHSRNRGKRSELTHCNSWEHKVRGIGSSQKQLHLLRKTASTFHPESWTTARHSKACPQ